ncbi:hypothetical protein BC830DRAFT_666541 [Chytriomyces sp. MP71]|nr:hypothetical protein BC830DRAFT_666541 [Chytriomyces sp. MP71]
MEHPAGDSVLRESGLELLKTAAGNGHRDLVLYLVGRGSFSEHHDGLIKTYRGLHFLLEASEQNALDTVFSTVLEGWRSDDDQQFALRWRMACEMACEHNYQELVRRLLEARAPAEKEDPQMRLKIRMFALALANGHTELAAKLLSWSAEEETDPQFGDALTGKTNMLAGLGTHSDIAWFLTRTSLLKLESLQAM